MINYKTFTSFDSNDSELYSYLKWWSEKTFVEPKMLDKTVGDLFAKLLFAVIVFDENKIIGAAGLIPCLKKNTTKMYEGDRLVVELASNYVDLLYREHNIGTKFVNDRLSFCKKKNYFPVSVTSNTYIQKIFEHIGCDMKNYPQYEEIYQGVRICDCSKKQTIHRVVCPMANKAIWVFKEFI